MKTDIMTKNNNKLKDFTKNQLIEIINKTTNKNNSFKQELNKFVKLKQNDFEHTNNLSRYSLLFDEAEEIISEFNEYGGGPEDKEERVYNNLPKIAELFNKCKLDQKTKIDFINRCFEQYYYGNSGFEDLLRDTIMDVCNCKEEWIFFIEKLNKSESNYDQNVIMKIYQEKLKDDETYLKLRMAKLHYGMDYYDLVGHYYKKGKIEKAISIAKEGIEKGDGRIIDLVDFLLKFYIKNKDYDNILKYQKLSFKENPSFEKYLEIKKFCNKSDINKVLKELDDEIDACQDNELKAKVNYYNGNLKPILAYIKNSQGDFYYDFSFKEWAKKMEPHFPNDLLKIYLNKVKRILEFKIAKEYHIAEYYLTRSKFIFLDILNNKDGWENLLSSLKQKSIKLPSFQKMLNNFEDKE